MIICINIYILKKNILISIKENTHKLVKIELSTKINYNIYIYYIIIKIK